MLLFTRRAGDMRVVIFGATGNVGSALVSRLSTNPDVSAVIGVARRPPSAVLPRVSWIPADIATDGLEGLLEGADAVVHLAWRIQPSRRERKLQRVNVAGTGRLLEATVRAGVPNLIYASSVGTYAPGPKWPPVTESWPTTGVRTSVYSRQKAAVEALLDQFVLAHPDLRVVRLRTSLVFQASAASEIARLFLGPLAPVRLLGRRGVPISVGNKGLVFQCVHASDAAAAYEASLFGTCSGAFNIAAEPVLDSASLAGALSARTIPIPTGVLRAAAATTYRARLQPTDPGWVDLLFGVPTMDLGAARKELGWQATQGAPDVLAELLGGFARRQGSNTVPLRAARGGLVTPLEPSRDRFPEPAAGTARATGRTSTPHQTTPTK